MILICTAATEGAIKWSVLCQFLRKSAPSQLILQYLLRILFIIDHQRWFQGGFFHNYGKNTSYKKMATP